MRALDYLQALLARFDSPHEESSPPIIDLMTLEDRVLYSVAPLVDPAMLADAQPAPDVQAVDAAAAQVDAMDAADVDLVEAPDAAEIDAALNPAPEPTPAEVAEDDPELTELVVLAADLHDLDEILADLQSQSTTERKFEVVLLNADEDGFAQLDRALAGDTKFDAIHFLTHGDSGMFRFGNTWFDQAAVQAHQLQISHWADSLSADADLLFYGCDLASNTDGKLLIERVHDLTGADVAASDDPTGLAIRGGDWDLEVRFGEIETGSPLSMSVQQHWDGILATYVVTNTNDSGAGSLRQAIDDANLNPAADTINFNIAGAGIHIIALAADLPHITDAVTIDATTQTSYSSSPLIALDGSAVVSSTAGIWIETDNTTLRGFAIYGFGDDGIEITGGAGFGDNNIIENNWIGLQADGTAAANADNGILITTSAANNTIRNNVISGNGAAGVLIRDAGSDNNTLVGNLIGLNSSGTATIGNATNGVRIEMGATNNIMGGSSAADRNVISGNGVEGILISGSGTNGNVLQGNYIGTDITGLVDLGNLDDGIEVHNGAANTIIGGSGAGEGNVIAGNNDEGVSLNGASNGTIVRGNLIGVGADGVTALGNGQYGIEILGDSANNVIGGTGVNQGNTIANSVSHGVYVQGAGSLNNAILGNSIYSNGGLGINLLGGTEDGFGITANDAGDGDAGANGLQNLPLLSAVASAGGNTYVRGTLNSAASTSYRIEFFSSPTSDAGGNGEASRYLGTTTVTTDGSGNASFDVTLSGVMAPTGYQLTATATADLGGGAFGGTSEFAANRTVAAGFQVAVDSASSGSADNQTVVTVAHTTSGSNRLMLVGISIDPHGDTITSVTYNGASLTFVGAQELAGAHSRVGIWSLVAPDLGTHNVVVNVSGTSYNGLVVGVTTFTGVNQTTPLLDFSGDSGNSTTASTSVNAATYDLVFGVVHSHQGSAAGAGAGQTELWDLANAGSNGSGTTEIGNGPVTTSWTVKSDDWSVAAVAIQSITNAGVTASLSPVQDSYIRSSSPNANAGSAGSMIVDRESTDLQRSLVQFDLSSIPVGATITSATLQLESTQIGGTITIDIRQILESWAEGSTTWNRRSSGVNWSTAGGSFSGSSIDTITTSMAGEHDFDLTSLVQAWVDGSQQNYGVMIASFDGGGNRTITYDTREGTTAPVLLVTYLPAANAAPTLDTARSPALSTVVEDAAAPSGAVGTLVSALVDFASPSGQVDNVTDPDSSAQLGIAVVGASSSGTWYFSEDNGGVWNLLGSVSGASARLLAADSTTRLYFQPNTDVNGTISSALTFRAWDQTSGWNGGLADTTSSGGTTAYSSATDTASILVTAVNDAPTLDNSSAMTFAIINEDQSAAGTNAAIIDSGGVNRISDVDSGALEGIAITGLTSGPGTWRYSIDGGSNYIDVGTVSNSSALLLRATDYLQYVGDGLNGGGSDVTFRAWDQTSGSAGAKVDTSTNGGTTAFSSAMETAMNTTTSVNDAPTLDNTASPTLNAQLEDAGPPIGAVGTLVSALIDTAGGGGNDNVGDVDIGAVYGIAITAADTANGSWFYSTDGGTSWNALGAVSNVSARLLASDSNTRVYFQSNADYDGTLTSALTFRAWDQTSGSNGATADTSSSGGTTAFSSATDTAALTITAANDAPTITCNGGGTSASVSIAENTTAVTTVTSTDTDGGTPTYSIIGGADAARFTITGAGGALSFQSAPDYEAPADTGGDNVYDVIVQVSDGAGGTDTQTIAVTVTGVNDASPVITSNGGGAGAYVNVAENATAVTTVSATDADLPVQSLTYSIVGGTDAAKFTIDANSGALVFDSPPDYEAPTDSNADNVYQVVVQVSDGAGGTDTQTIAVTVTAVNEANPVITSNGGGAGAFVSTAENTTAVTNVTATDTDLPAQTLTFSIVGGSDAAQFSIDVSSGALVFTTAPDYEAPTDSNTDNVYNVIVQVSDGAGGTVTQAISVTVTDTAERPAGANQTLTVLEEGTHTFLVADFGFTDQDAGDSLAAVRIDAVPAAGSLTLLGVNVTAGQVVTAADIAAGNLQFNPAPDANGVGYASLTFSVRDQSGLYDLTPNAFTFDVTATNDAPTILAPVDQVLDEDTTLGPLTITIGDVDNSPAGLIVTATSSNQALIPDSALILGGSGASRTITFTPAANAFGGPITIQLSVDDGNTTTITSFQVVVNSVNDVPQMTFPTVVATEDTPFAMSGTSAIVVADNDGTNSILTITLGFQHGTLTLATTAGITFLSGDGATDAALTFRGTVTDMNAALDGAVYQADANFFGADQITFQVQDVPGAISAGSSTITVAAVNDGPTAANEQFSIFSGESLNIAAPGLVSNASDTEGDPLTTMLVQGPDHGSLTLNPDGSFRYTPSTSFFGSDSFVYQVSDGGLNSTSAVVQIQVIPFAAGGPGGSSTGYGSGGSSGDSNQDSSDSDSDSETNAPTIVAGVSVAPAAPEVRSRSAPATSGGEGEGESTDGATEAAASPDGAVDGLATLPGGLAGGATRTGHAGRHDAAAEERRGPNGETDWSQVTETEVLDSLLNTLKEELQSEQEVRDLVATTAAASTAALTAGYALWALKSGHLLASLLAGMPAWRQFDPLPVVERYGKADEDNESLVDIASTK